MTPTELLSSVSNMSPSAFFASLADVHNNFHVFDKIATPEIILFEIILVAISAISIIFLRKQQKKVILRWFVGFLIFTLFQMFTASMFSTEKLGSWAYIYIKTSWIISMAWATFILWADHLSNKYLNKHTIKNFVLSTVILSFIALAFEAIMINLGIRIYSDDTLRAFSGTALTLFPVYYSFIISLFVMSFYKYWNLKIDNEIIVPVKKYTFLSFFVCFIGILSFDVMTRTMVTNVGFWSWSYILPNVSIALTLIGTIMIWLSVSLIDEFLGYFDILKKFVLYFTFSIIPVFLLEAFLISRGMRIYGQETVNNFSGFILPVFYLPVEVPLGSVFYLLIILPFVTYVIFLTNQKNIKTKNK